MSTHMGELSPFFSGGFPAGTHKNKYRLGGGRAGAFRLTTRMCTMFLVAVGLTVPAMAQFVDIEESRRWNGPGPRFQGPLGVPKDTLADEYFDSIGRTSRFGDLPGDRAQWGFHVAQPPKQEQGHEGGSVSMAELLHPLEGDAREQIQTAERLLDEGKRDAAIGVLEAALEMPGARPYALGMLGAQYLSFGDVAVATQTLKMAVDALPGHAGNHSNLAYALGLSGNLDAAVGYARRAVQLDPSRPKSRYVLGWILLNQGEAEESLHHLKLAAVEIPSAMELIEMLEAQGTATAVLTGAATAGN